MAESATRSGPGRALVAVYGVFALAATGRSVLQLTLYADRAPIPYALSAFAALVYLAATFGLAGASVPARRVAWAACLTELVGVLVVGAISTLRPDLFPDDTVWSGFGRGYGYIPLVLPVAGLAWLLWVRRHESPRR